MITYLRILLGALLADPRPSCFGTHRILSEEGRAIADCATCRHLQACHFHKFKPSDPE